jgi:hypothetical protein
MRRQAAVLVVVAAAVLLSGCSLLGGPTSTPTDGPTPTATATPSPTASPSPTPTPAPYPSGYAAGGVTNATAARQGHVEGLLSTANFTLGYNATVRTDDGTSRITLVQAVSPAEPRAISDTLISASGDRGSGAVRRTRFYVNGTQYLRVQRDGNTTYGTIDGTVPPATFVGRQYVDAALTNVSYDDAARVERSGGTFFRFTADDIDDPGALLSGRVAAENVTGGNVTLVVDGDGVVRSVRYRATVQRDGGTVRYGVAFAIAGIDRTPVQRPDWARER